MAPSFDDLPELDQKTLLLLADGMTLEQIAAHLNTPVPDIQSAYNWLRLALFVESDAQPQSLVEAARNQGWLEK